MGMNTMIIRFGNNGNLTIVNNPSTVPYVGESVLQEKGKKIHIVQEVLYTYKEPNDLIIDVYTKET